LNKYWIEAKKVTAKKNGFKVIDNLNLKIKSKERVLILGPNGSGKSSIVDLINRNIYPLEKKNSSFKLFNKKLINIWDLRQKISTVNNDVKYRINPNLLVIDVIISGLYGKFCEIKNANRMDLSIAKELIKKMSLSGISNKRFGNLSDGEKQISLIARAIINNPEILILDEPSINLDLRSKIFLINKLQELSKNGINILCITHDIEMISNNYSRIILLKDRKIIADGIPEKIMRSKNINKLFDTRIKVLKHKNNWSISR
tara:strand:- start:12024 stop:12800 length:777 start_codon:yes stop_codon:yes gene_type:complete